MFLPAGTTSLTLRRIEGPPAESARIAAWSRSYHALVVGEAVLVRSAAGGWSVPVSRDGRLLPLPATASACSPAPTTRRVLVLFSPADVGRAPRAAPAGVVGRQPRTDFYGWSLLYQPPGMRGRALVDAHDEFADLPSFYASGAELVDRVEFLATRGIPARPLALLASPDDDLVTADGRTCNRFIPRADRGAGRRDR